MTCCLAVAGTFVHHVTTMEKLKRKTRMMLAIEIAIYLVIAISVALLIIL